MKKILFIVFIFLCTSSYAQKISELPVTTTIGSPDWLVALKVGASTANRITVDSFRNYLLNSSGTGILPIANGGTNSSTANGALNNLLPSQVGNANKFLQTDGTNATWVSSSAGVTSVSATSPLSSSGGATPTISITSPLPLANGGTNAALTASNGALFYSTASTGSLTATSNVYWDATNGRLGLGTTNPSNQLVISNAGAAGIEILSNPTSILSINRTSLLYSPLIFAALSYNWEIGGVGTIMTGSTTGIGIGNISATEKLHVDGNIRFSGALMPNNTAGTSGQVLTSAGAGLVPTWTTPTTGTVTNIATGTGLTGGPITGTGTISVSTIPVANGGTNITSYAVGDLLYASGATTLSKLAGVATGNALISGGVTTAPSWGKIDMTTHVNGILPLANGGTNTSISASNGSVIYSDASKYAMTGVGTIGQILQSNGATAPTFVSDITPTSVTTESVTITTSAITNPISLNINNEGDYLTTANSTGALIRSHGAWTSTGIDVATSSINGGVSNAITASSIISNPLGYNNGIGVFASGGLYNTSASLTASGGTTAKGIHISASGATNNYGIYMGSGDLLIGSGRVLNVQGTDVASVAGAITLSSNGNVFEITGTNAITLISNVGWQNGSEVTLMFAAAATLTNGTATSGTNITIHLSGAANFIATADDVVKLVLSEIGGVQEWREVSRSVN